ncbi:MAG: DUF262 domain-containing HNH endonuclease family protein [Nostoc sp.]|uniref:DUF262 domain-containing protein n=1 Tax=Nostoc sp. TaxID=1180 RepID=UPI002FF89B61
MATSPRIESSNLSIADLFREFYSVPDFQREYVWEKSNVEKLLQDIVYELYDEGEAVEDAEYFLGSIVVFRDETETSQLIDGQQRLTTIYLMFCAIRDYLLEFRKPSKVVEGLIAGVAQDLKSGEDINKYRLTLQYGDGAGVLKTIAAKEITVEKIDTQSSASAKRLVEAYETIREFLSEMFVETSERILKFSSVLSNKVKLIKIETPNLKNALKVFETINDRGVGLSSLDLLKNYLFINISTQSNSSPKLYWEKLKKQWDKLTKILHICGESPMQFLRYYIMSHYEINLQNNFPEEAVYEWFVENSHEHKIHENPFNFVERLVTTSEYYANFVNGENIDGSVNPYLKNIKRLQGRYSQHFVLLLAGKNLTKDLFIELCHQIENLLFVYTITRSTRKDVNMIRSFSQWSRNLIEVKSSEQFKDFIDSNFKSELASLSLDFDLAFRGLTESKIAKFRMRYILAKLTQLVDEQAYSNSNSLDWYLNKSVTIEHILPKSSKEYIKDEFDKPIEYDSYLEKLGNLILLEKTINSSIADNTFDAKKNGYRESQLLLTRSLVEKPSVGTNTQLNRTVKSLNLYHFDIWDSTAIEKRQEMLTNLARRVWGLDT